jgi:hypothetical protein
MSDGVAISIEADDVVLDCGGYAINGSGGGLATTARGIAIDRGHVVVRDCTVRGFEVGIEAVTDDLEPVGGVVIEGNRIIGSASLGIAASSSGAVIRGNLVADTGGGSAGGSAQAIDGSYDAEIVDNIVDGVTGGSVEDAAGGIAARRSGIVARNRIRNLVAAEVTGIGIGGDFAGEQYGALAHDNMVSIQSYGEFDRALFCSGDLAVTRGYVGFGIVGDACQPADPIGMPAIAGTPRVEATNCKVIGALPAVITARGTYCLATALSTSIASGAAITIAADNVTLDCLDRVIDGSGAGDATAATGIAATQRSGVVVRNCAVRGFRNGIRLVEEPGSSVPPSAVVVENNRVHRNTRTGISLHADGGVVRGNLVMHTGAVDAAGIGIQAKYSTDVVDNRVVDVDGAGAYGINVALAHGVTVAGNRVTHFEPSAGAVAIRLAPNSLRVLAAGNVTLGLPYTEATALSCGHTSQRSRGNTAIGFAAPAFVGSCAQDGSDFELALAP